MATAKKTVARKTAPVAVHDEDEQPEPLVRLKRSRVAPETLDRVLLFTKEYDDGEVQEFWVPKRKMASMALKYLHMTREDGDNIATAWLMERVLGKVAYEDLMDDDQLGDDELVQIFAIVQNAVLGAVEDPKGKRG